MPETFQPEVNGWKLQRGYSIVPRFPVVEDSSELGSIKSVATADKALRVFRGLRWLCLGRAPAEYAQSFFRRHKGPAGRFFWAAPEYVPSPDKAPTLTAIASGSQGSRTIFVKFAWKTGTGVTLASPAASLLVGVNNLLKVTIESFPPGVTQAVIYATQGAAGTEVEQTTLTNVQTWTQPNAALLTGNPAPATVNGALEVPQVKLVGSYELTRGDGLLYELALELEETYT